MKLESSREAFDAWCAAAAQYWAGNVLPGGTATIVVDALHPEFRVTLRNLTIANALRRMFPARLVMVTGTDRWWIDALWHSFDVSLYRELGEAFGAEVIDVHALVDGHLEHGSPLLPDGLWGPGRDLPELDPAPADVIARTVDATYCRLQWVPRPNDEDRAGPEYDAIRRRTEAFAELYRQLFSRLRPEAFVTSHVDYNHWGPAVDMATAAGVPIVYAQQNGGLKAYAAWAEHRTPGRPLRADLTVRTGELFEQVWANRDRLRDTAERMAARNKGNLGRPIWWRAGVGSVAELANPVQRAQVRAIAMRRLGLDPAKPVVVVFNHAVSDAVGGNIEFFDDLADWFAHTADFAAHEPAVNWLLLDHPSQSIYDRTGFIDGVAAQYADVRHLRFTNSLNVGKNLLWSLVDLGVTVRGSVSNELPAFGMPVVQAGWSEWSACGVSQVATGREDYWRLLGEDIRLLADGRPVITPEQQERARLWLWFYRAATDITTPLIPHWSEGAGDETLRLLGTRMTQAEADGDPMYLALHRMWTRREAALTRFDLASPDEYEAAVLPVEDARG